MKHSALTSQFALCFRAPRLGCDVTSISGRVFDGIQQNRLAGPAQSSSICDCACFPTRIFRKAIVASETILSRPASSGGCEPAPGANGFWTVVSASCAELLDQWIDRAAIAADSYFLGDARCIRYQKPLTPTRHRLIYRELAVRAGFPRTSLGTLSMRVGCAGCITRHGYSSAQIMRRGNWSNSEMVARYTEATALQPFCFDHRVNPLQCH